MQILIQKNDTSILRKRSTTFYTIFLVSFFLIIFIFAAKSCFSQPNGNGLNDIVLDYPVNHSTIRQMGCLFKWDMPKETQNAIQYELFIESKNKKFNKRIMIEPQSSGNKIEYMIHMPDTSYRGIYNWQITLLESGGIRKKSDIQSFFWFPVNQKTSQFIAKFFPYAVELKWNHYLKTNEYFELIREIQPQEQLENYTSIGLVYHQDRLLVPILECKETYRLLSKIGVGCEFEGRLNIWDNKYVSISPKCRVGYTWYSTGIQKYSNQYQDLRYGMDITINPRKYIVIKPMFIPRYQFHYFTPNNELRTWTGKGWSFGMEMVMSKSILNSFTIGGINIDPLRFPFNFTYSYIKDSYTGKKLTIRQFRISYLLR